jgi:hypothetical protein
MYFLHSMVNVTIAENIIHVAIVINIITIKTIGNN